MAKQTRSSVFAFKKESTEGSYIAPSSATDFTVLRQGFSFESAVQTVTSDELVNDIGATESLVTRESPTGKIPKYFKHSGVEGQAPDYGLFLESALGLVTVNATQYNTASGSTAGTASTAGTVVVGSGNGANFYKGQAILLKDGANGYAIRNIAGISGDTLTLAFNLGSAPASGVALGKAITYLPSVTGQPTFTAHLYQSASGSALHQAIAGCRTTNLSAEFTANQLATLSCDFEGISAYMNPVTITGANSDIDFVVGASTYLASLGSKTYKSTIDLAREVATKMSAAAGSTVNCSYSNVTGKFTISVASGTFTLEWNTGANTATSAAAALGFSTAADSSGSQSYTSATAQSYDAPYTPSLDSQGPSVVRANEFTFGDFSRNDNKSASKVSLTIATPKTDVEDLTALTGVSESVVKERVVTLTATLVFKQHELAAFDALLNNGTVAVAFNHGPKSNGNWVAGQCVNVYLPQAKVTKNTVSDNNGIVIVELECKAFVSSSTKDCYINYV